MSKVRGVEISVDTFRGSILADGKRRKPSGFSAMEMEPEHKAFVTHMAVETFTKMVNHGHTFQGALTAVYLSGIEHAINSLAEKDQ